MPGLAFLNKAERVSLSSATTAATHSSYTYPPRHTHTRRVKRLHYQTGHAHAQCRTRANGSLKDIHKEDVFLWHDYKDQLRHLISRVEWRNAETCFALVKVEWQNLELFIHL